MTFVAERFDLGKSNVCVGFENVTQNDWLLRPKTFA
jgi:hypothetical protein